MNVLGLRDLEPAGVVPVYKPYAHITLNDEELRKLPPSRKPTPTDPNYLCSFEEVVHLPRDVRFAPSIAVTVKDRKVAGLPATTLGAVSIPLDHKMVPPSTPGSGTASVPGRAVAQFRPGNPFLSAEDLINSQILLHDSALTQKEDESRWEDTDKGRSEKASVQASLAQLVADTRSQMPSDDVPEYLHRRLSIPTELELALREAPFERYPITTGSVASGAENVLDKPFSQVGTLKCTVSARPEGSPPPNTLTRISTSEQEVKVPTICLRLCMCFSREVTLDFHSRCSSQIRLYVLRASNLAGHDDDNLSDPFLVVKLGNKTHSTRNRFKHSTRDPRFFEVFEFHSKLPGINDILISVKDHNDYTLDELIGSTVIDLEDR
jgi:hypothetical protein